MLELSFFILKSLFNIDDFFFLACKRPTHFSDLMLKLVLELYDPLFSPLEVESLLPKLTFKSFHLSERLIEARFSIRLLHFPVVSDLFYFLYFSLFQVGFEFGLFGSFPHFELPNCLVVSIWRSCTWWLLWLLWGTIVHFEVSGLLKAVHLHFLDSVVL